jgi:excisionase family DNA binding protein
MYQKPDIGAPWPSPWAGLLTVNQACARLAISKTLLRKELQKHRLPVVRIGRKLLIPVQTCDDLVRLGVTMFNPFARRSER